MVSAISPRAADWLMKACEFRLGLPDGCMDSAHCFNLETVVAFVP